MDRIRVLTSRTTFDLRFGVFRERVNRKRTQKNVNAKCYPVMEGSSFVKTGCLPGMIRGGLISQNYQICNVSAVVFVVIGAHLH